MLYRGYIGDSIEYGAQIRVHPTRHELGLQQGMICSVCVRRNENPARFGKEGDPKEARS